MKHSLKIDDVEEACLIINLTVYEANSQVNVESQLSSFEVLTFPRSIFHRHLGLARKNRNCTLRQSKEVAKNLNRNNLQQLTCFFQTC